MNEKTIKRILLVCGTVLAAVGGGLMVEALYQVGIKNVAALAVLGFVMAVLGLDLNLYACERFR